MFADYHVHTAFSDDSQEPMENQIKRAIQLGLDEICFTEHVDYGIKRDFDDPRGFKIRRHEVNGKTVDDVWSNCDYPNYFKMLKEMKSKYPNITIKQGLEFGVQSITVNEFEKLFSKYENELDFILFSMHQVDNKQFWMQEFQAEKTQKEYNDAYYIEIYKTMKMFKHYSCLAHLDLLSRYDLCGVYPFEKEEEIIAEILKLAIQDGKGIELNTSSWHYGLKDTQPSRKILKLYKDLGGKIITVGSDGHSTKYVADHIQDAYAILKEIGFTQICTFDHMQPIFHDM